MNKIILSLLLLIAANLRAQIPTWVLHPSYDAVKPLRSGYFVITKNGKQGILNGQEKEVVPIKYDKIDFFNNDTGLLYNNDHFVGYVSNNGVVKDVEDKNFKPVCLNRFSNGYLAVSNITGYYYLSEKNDTPLGPFTYAYPFSEGYAWVRVPKSAKHILDGSYTFDVLSAETGTSAQLALGNYDKDDIDFISTSSNGKCIIVLKKRFYEYDYKSETLTPLSTDNNPENKSSRVTALERPVAYTAEGDRFRIQFKQGSMTFDPMMRLTSISYTGQPTQTFEVPQPEVITYESPIVPITFNDTKLLGLKYLNKDVLAAQFEEVTRRWDDFALVKQNGKYGVLQFDPKHTCRLILNENKDIGFEHKMTTADIKVICPPYMQLPLMTLSSLDKNCTINIDTRQENSNIETSALSYNCMMEIPKNLGIKKMASSASFAINYDGLKFTPTVIPFNTWYINNYTVQLLSHQLNGQVLTADILVKNTGQNNEGNYFEVSIQTSDSTVCEFNKVTEELYSARLSEFTENTVNFSVEITEDGCPPLSYPFSVNVKGNASTANGKDTENIKQGQKGGSAKASNARRGQKTTKATDSGSKKTPEKGKRVILN